MQSQYFSSLVLICATRDTHVSAKFRRVKCDEEQPTCSRCMKAGRICEGYVGNPKPWLFEPSNLYELYETTEERQLADFYRNPGISYLSMIAYSAAPFSAVFAQQLAQSHPAVKHAMLALSAQMQASIYRYATDASKTRASIYRARAMVQYNSGIMALATVDTSVPKEAILVAGTLLAMLEMWPQKGRAPHVHVKAGLDLGRAESENVWRELSIKGYVLRGFMWMAHLLSAYYDGVSTPKVDSVLVYAINPEGIPGVYTTSSSAVEGVEVLLRSVMHLRSSHNTAEAWSRHRQLVAVHAEISSSIEASKATAHEHGDFHHDLTMLQIHLRVVSLILSTYGTQLESTWDKYHSVFACILAGIETLLPCERQVCNGSKGGVFRPTLGLICPLFGVAIKSRDLAQRQRALFLLHGLKRKERSWNSCIATQIARAVVNLETRFAFLQGEIGTPEECRVRLDSVVFEESQQEIVEFYRRMSASKTKAEMESITVPWEPQVDYNYDFVHMSRKALACFGYTGIHMLVPAIECQCHPTPSKFPAIASESDISASEDLELR